MAAPAWLLMLGSVEHPGRCIASAAGIEAWDRAFDLGLVGPGELLDTVESPGAAEYALTVMPGLLTATERQDLADGQTGVLGYLADPDDGTDPRIVAAGPLVDVAYGGDDEPLTCSISSSPAADRGTLPPHGSVIDDVTWPNRDPDGVPAGEWYPVVFGAPGDATVNAVGSPVYYCQTGATDYLLMAGHTCALAAGSTATIYDRANGISQSLRTIHVDDGLGRKVTVAVSSASYTIWVALTAGGEFWAIWDSSDGLRNDDGTVVRGAGDVIEWLLRQSTLQVDWGRMRAARSALNLYKIDAYILPQPGRTVSPWGWIEEHLLPILPVEERVSNLGLYLAVFDPFATAGAATAWLEDGRNCERISPVTVVQQGEPASTFALSYCPRADDGTYGRSLTLSGDPAVLSADSAAIASASCAETFRRFGPSRKDITTNVVYDGVTAAKVLAHRARMARCQEVAYSIAPDVSVEVGDVVSLTDAAVGFSARAAHVWMVRDFGQPDREVVLRLWA